jgi:hypothetical protein
MSFRYACECGYSLPISAASAGTTVSCRCGRPVKIPKLSELKRLSGQVVEPLIGIADQLRTMYLDKQLPPDSNCVCCQTKTAETLDCWVECERTYDRNGKGWAMAILFVWSLPLYLLTRAFNRGSAHEVDGRELIVRTPLPICENCQDTVSRDSANIRQLLQRVQLYRQLLEKYPHARVGAS